VISRSLTDLQRAFAEMAMSAARLCDACDAAIRQADGEVLRIVAHHGPIPSPVRCPCRVAFLMHVPFSTGERSPLPICKPKWRSTPRAVTVR